MSPPPKVLDLLGLRGVRVLRGHIPLFKIRRRDGWPPRRSVTRSRQLPRAAKLALQYPRNPQLPQTEHFS